MSTQLGNLLRFQWLELQNSPYTGNSEDQKRRKLPDSDRSQPGALRLHSEQNARLQLLWSFQALIIIFEFFPIRVPHEALSS